MAAKVTFDHINRLILPLGPPVDGVISLDVQVDLYSDGKEDWLTNPTLHKYRFPLVAIGGQAVAGGVLGTTYLLTNGWRIDPDLNEVIQVGSTVVGGIPIYGGSGVGLNETVHQQIALSQPSTINRLWVTVRKVGNPTDNLRLVLHNASMVEYGSVELDGSLLTTSFQEWFAAMEQQTILPTSEFAYIHFERTGTRDEANYFEVAYDNDVYPGGTALVRDNGVYAPFAGDLVVRFEAVVPYQLQIVGNIYTDSGVPVALPSSNVNVQTVVSTLVEVRQLYEQALEDIRKYLLNAFETDPVAGKIRVYDDDDTTVFLEGDIWEDISKTQPYRGQGVERRDRLA